MAGNAGFGSSEGGVGGAVAQAGNGARGGTITVDASLGTLTIHGSAAIDADAGKGGNQFGTGGKGGNSDGTGGKGGDVRKAGSGGSGGGVTISYNQLATDSPGINATAKLGAVGEQHGTAGDGGKSSKGSTHDGLPGTVDDKSAKPGAPGTVVINGVVQ
jgi:hypothetical protein